MAELFVSNTLVAILSRFAIEPERSYYQRELTRAIGSSLHQVQRELARLERVGLVERTPRGRQVEYTLVPGHAAWPGLRQTLLRTVAVGHAIATALTPLWDEIDLAWVFGSVARGDDVASSDIDLMVIGDVTFKDVAQIDVPEAVGLGRELNVVAYDTEDFVARHIERHHLVERVLAEPKLWVIGDDEELARTLGTGTVEA